MAGSTYSSLFMNSSVNRSKSLHAFPLLIQHRRSSWTPGTFLHSANFGSASRKYIKIKSRKWHRREVAPASSVFGTELVVPGLLQHHILIGHEE